LEASNGKPCAAAEGCVLPPVPTLQRQADRKVNFVENLVGTYGKNTFRKRRKKKERKSEERSQMEENTNDFDYDALWMDGG
jgi:hypothetical protein